MGIRMNCLLPAVFLILCCFQFELSNSAVPEGTCKDFVAAMTKKQLSGISTCTKEMKFKNPKEKSAKMTCILRCVLIREGLLNKEGKLVQSEMTQFIEDNVPSNLVPKALPLFTHCVDTTAAALDKELDAQCKVIDPFIKCLLDLLGNLCK